MPSKSLNNANKVILRKTQHNGSIQIALFFPNMASLNKKAKLIGAVWSKTLKCWIVPYKKENYLAIKETFCDCDMVVEKEEQKGLERNLLQQTPLKIELTRIGTNREPIPVPGSIRVFSENNKNELNRYEEILTLKGYSSNTQRTYKNEFRTFLHQIKNVEA